MAPGRGATHDMVNAFRYPEDHTHLKSMARISSKGGVKLRLRQAPLPEAAPLLEECDECRGTGRWGGTGCPVCDGTGVLKVGGSNA